MTGESAAHHDETENRRPLRVLVAEDSEDDALLLMRQLRRGGLAAVHHRVESMRGLEVALRDVQWDLIIAGCNMPRFAPDDVLDTVRQRGIDVPIILVSAHAADARVADVMKAGINDYVHKDNLSRLAPAVERELREAENRRAYRRTSAELEYAVRHDMLTGLANRSQIEKRLAAALAAVDDRGHAFLCLDIDQFHMVNDMGGYAAGDELVRRLARVLAEQVRESDTLARIGPDEFAVLLERCPLSSAWRMAETLRRAVADFRLDLDGGGIRVTASIGLVAITEQGECVNDVLRRADLACRVAKDRGHNRIRAYSARDHDLARRRGDMEWITRLREGLDEDRFVLFRQPIRPLGDDAGEAFSEVLLRLVGDDGQLVEAGRFVPAAERFDLMPLIDRRVIRDALEGIRDAGDGDAAARWFINLSGRSLSDEGLAGHVRAALADCGVDPARICFEVTETAAITHMALATRFMQEVRALGCRVALDDFGSGLSSFSYLRALPADYLKIDGTFVRRMLERELDYTIVEAITRIGHAAGMRVIAEMAESEALIDALRALGVDYAQGHAMGVPEPLGGTGVRRAS